MHFARVKDERFVNRKVEKMNYRLKISIHNTAGYVKTDCVHFPGKQNRALIVPAPKRRRDRARGIKSFKTYFTCCCWFTWQRRPTIKHFYRNPTSRSSRIVWRRVYHLVFTVAFRVLCYYLFALIMANQSQHRINFYCRSNDGQCTICFRVIRDNAKKVFSNIERADYNASFTYYV